MHRVANTVGRSLLETNTLLGRYVYRPTHRLTVAKRIKARIKEMMMFPWELHQNMRFDVPARLAP